MLLEEGGTRSDRCVPVSSQEAACSKYTRRTVSGSVRVPLQTYRRGQLDRGTRDQSRQVPDGRLISHATRLFRMPSDAARAVCQDCRQPAWLRLPVTAAGVESVLREPHRCPSLAPAPVRPNNVGLPGSAGPYRAVDLRKRHPEGASFRLITFAGIRKEVRWSEPNGCSD